MVRIVAGVLLLFFTAPVVAAAPAAGERPGPTAVRWRGGPGAVWADYDRLVAEQKFEAAAARAAEVLARAEAAGEAEEWTRALVRTVQLRTALHGFETAVRFLRAEPWPQSLLADTVLHLFYAHALVTYARAYSWEVGQRERVASRGEVDLNSWTRDQIHAAARDAYLHVWERREELGAFSATALAEYVEPGTYPPRIRPSLRDAVSYLLADLLADTAGWRPEEASRVYLLDLAALLGEPRAAPDLADPRVHPLEKVVGVLGDLERWHGGRNEREAAFEARLERLRLLRESFAAPEDRARLRADLEARLPTVRDLPWWAVGVALRAELVRAEETPDHLARARAVARAGDEAYPDSVGGRRCRHLVRTIEAPAYRLEGMASDGPGKRSLGLQYKNLGTIHFRAYALDLPGIVERTGGYGVFPDRRGLEGLLRSRPDREWTVELPAAPDFELHRTYVVPPVTKPGFYVVAASARADFAPGDNQILGVQMVIGDLVLLTRRLGDEVEVTAASGATGRPVPGTRVLLYRLDGQTRHRVAATGFTGADGTVRFRAPDARAAYFFLARAGDDLAVEPDPFRFPRAGEPEERTDTLLYTDRSLYRPLQTLRWKAVAYRGRSDEGRYRTAPGRSLTVSLRDPNGQVVAEEIVATNAFGSAAGEFTIPAGHLLGAWQITSSLGGAAGVRVEEYKRPTFEVALRDPEVPLRLNRAAVLAGEARYYFGLPVASGEVAWRVTRIPAYPVWWGYRHRGWEPSTVRAEVVAAGTARLEPDGTFRLAFTPRADERLDAGVTYRYEATAEVTDEGGETRDASRVFRLGAVAVEATVRRDVGFFREGMEDAALTILRTDLDGQPAPGKGSWRVLALAGPDRTLLPADQPLPPDPKGAFRTPGDRRRPRWNPGYDPAAALALWPDGAEVARGEVTHGPEGEARVALPPLPEGAYRLRYATADPFGARFETAAEFLVAGAHPPVPLPALLLAERSSVPAGGTARLLVHSGLPDQPLVLELFRDGRRVERRVLASGRDPSLVELPVTGADRGGFGATLSVLRDHQLVTLSAAVFVPWDDKELRVEFETFRDRLRPGQEETWTVKVTAPAGGDAAVAGAEVLAYMYDRSLDAFAAHVPPDPLHLYPNRTAVSWPDGSLGPARGAPLPSRGFRPVPGNPPLTGAHLRFYDGYGIGGPGLRSRGRLGREALMEGAPMPMAARLEVAEAKAAGVRDEVAAPTAAPLAEAPPEAPTAAPSELRSDFSETAFWEPHLLTGADGSVSFRFRVPDAVTSWNVWVHALTRGLHAGSARREVRTAKELIVRPYLPRFLREGDRAALKVVVNNASDRELAGELAFDLVDPGTDESLLAAFGLSASEARKSFRVPAGDGTSLVFPVAVPPGLRTVAVRVTARSGDLSDGELRPVPVLPGRIHLAQSRFAVLKDAGRRELRFADLAADDDPTRIQEELVVTLDAQLFYAVLSAVPYLADYPYACTEQTLNRFLSTGILASLYADYPAVERMARALAKRDTRLEPWDAADPNRKMALEETPWLMEARGGEEGPGALARVLDPEVARARRDASLAKLVEAQTASGGFPWFPGGPPSPYMTLYLLHGFARGLEFGVKAPTEVIQRAWAYLHRHYLDELARRAVGEDRGWEFVTFLDYVLTAYPDDSWTGGVFTDADRRAMLDLSLRHWREHSPYLKGYLSLTLNRRGRPEDARRVWQSVMDAAQTTEEQGTFWAPEDRGWLWYNDTIETHAFAVRTLLELAPEDPRLDGLVLWLFLHKTLNHWESTRATAEVVYSLARYLRQTGRLAVREEATVIVGPRRTTFVFEPDRFTGRDSRVVLSGDRIDPATSATVVVEKATPGSLFASATWHFSTARLPAAARGDLLGVTRTYFKRVGDDDGFRLEPLAEGAALAPGDQVEVHLSLTAKHPVEYVHLRDPRGAGFEPESAISGYRWGLGVGWYEEVRDSGTNFFLEALPQGEYTFTYRLRAATAGTFRVAPATVQPLYAPEFVAYSAGHAVRIEAAR